MFFLLPFLFDTLVLVLFVDLHVVLEELAVVLVLPEFKASAGKEHVGLAGFQKYVMV